MCIIPTSVTDDSASPSPASDGRNPLGAVLWEFWAEGHLGLPGSQWLWLPRQQERNGKSGDVRLLFSPRWGVFSNAVEMLQMSPRLLSWRETGRTSLPAWVKVQQNLVTDDRAMGEELP